MKIIPTRVTGNLDDNFYFDSVIVYWYFYNLPKDHPCCLEGHSLQVYKTDKDEWQIGSAGNPWYTYLKDKLIEKEKNYLKELQGAMQKEHLYVLKESSENKLPYENISAPYTNITITRNGRVVREINKFQRIPIHHPIEIHSDIDENKARLRSTEDYPNVDYSELFLGPLKSQPEWIKYNQLGPHKFEEEKDVRPEKRKGISID